MTKLGIGDRVRIKAQPDWPVPPGYRFEGAEGTIVKWVEYEQAMTDFTDSVVCVRIDKAESKVYVESSLIFRVEDVEKL